eukprot:2413937-Prymnesium_polylepis.1
MLLATGGHDASSFEYVPGGGARRLSRHAGEPLLTLAGGADEALGLSRSGRVLRLALGSQAFETPQ